MFLFFAEMEKIFPEIAEYFSIFQKYAGGGEKLGLLIKCIRREFFMVFRLILSEIFVL